jgi:hypothetical protein
MLSMSMFLFVLVAAPAAAADVRLDQYRHPENQKMREFQMVFLDGVKSGLMAYNARVHTHGGEEAFCMPDDLLLTTERAEEIMLQRADKVSAKGDIPVSLLLLAGLRDTFPCEKAKGRK